MTRREQTSQFLDNGVKKTMIIVDQLSADDLVRVLTTRAIVSLVREDMPRVAIPHDVRMRLTKIAPE